MSLPDQVVHKLLNLEQINIQAPAAFDKCGIFLAFNCVSERIAVIAFTFAFHVLLL